jgi:tartrate/fumarate subfamily iron-sulfur-dependent hydro-lyase beta chain
LLLNGKLLTGRDAAHKRMTDMLNRGEKLPVDFKDRFIYYVGPVDPVREEVVGPAGPTTATRMDKFTRQMLAETGLLGMVGKAERGPIAIEAIREFGAVYLMAVGGAAYLVSKAIYGSRLLAFADLGMEAIYEFDVRDMSIKPGPRSGSSASPASLSCNRIQRTLSPTCPPPSTPLGKPFRLSCCLNYLRSRKTCWTFAPRWRKATRLRAEGIENDSALRAEIIQLGQEVRAEARDHNQGIRAEIGLLRPELRADLDLKFSNLVNEIQKMALRTKLTVDRTKAENETYVHRSITPLAERGAVLEMSLANLKEKFEKAS